MATEAGVRTSVRQPELAAVAADLEGLAEGPVAVVVEGEAGIGKTTLWREAIELAERRGYRVLTARPADVEARLSFAGVADLLGAIADEALASLPPPQRRALEVALLLAEPEGPPDVRAVGTATLGALRALSAERPVAVAVDDVQWLDPASASVLGFALRRLVDEPVGALLTRRTGSASAPLGLDAARVVTLGPLSLGALQHVLRSRLGTGFPRRTLRRIHAASHGNPFFALEVGRALLRRNAALTLDEPLPVPTSVHDLVRTRLGDLPAETVEALRVVAVLAEPTTSAVPAAALGTALDAGVVELEGDRIRFVHPLVAEALRATTPPGARGEIHRRAAEAAPTLEERARHLALAAAGPDAEVARLLDIAAADARARGALESAAELARLAIAATPRGDAARARRRRLAASDRLLEAGDDARALLTELHDELPAGPERAAVLVRLASAYTSAHNDVSRAVSLAEQALAEAESDARLRCDAESFLAGIWLVESHPARALPHARRALAHAEAVADAPTVARCAALTGFAETYVGEITRGLLERAVEIEEREGVSRPYHASPMTAFYSSPAAILGLRLMLLDRPDESRKLLRRAGERAPDDFSRVAAESHLAELECRVGDLSAAEEATARARNVADQFDDANLRLATPFLEALIAALRGREQEARERIAEGLAFVRRSDNEFVRIRHLSVLAFLELSLGRVREADRLLRPLAARLLDLGWCEPSVHGVLPNAIEAAIAVGDVARAGSMLERLEEAGRRLDSPWALAQAHRCRALLVSAEGDAPGALAAVDAALAEHARLPVPLERGRTLLVAGMLRRRARQNRAAREAFAEALAVFDRLGAEIWASRAREELARVAGRAPAHGLTPTEQRVAELAAGGLTTKEIASTLVVSPKTVENHLSRIYAKLGVRSRVQLGHVLRR